MAERSNVTVRFDPTELDTLDRLAKSRGCSRSEALRAAFRLGAPFAKDGFSINFTRVAEVIEQVGASMAIIVHRDHPDYIDDVVRLTNDAVDRYHA